MNCKHCIHDTDRDDGYCGKCNINPNHKNEFKSKDSYYPLELQDTHINLWNIDGKTKYTIALFTADSDGYHDLSFVGDRPLDKRVDKTKFFELIDLGYKIFNKKNEND